MNSGPKSSNRNQQFRLRSTFFRRKTDAWIKNNQSFSAMRAEWPFGQERNQIFWAAFKRFYWADSAKVCLNEMTLQTLMAFGWSLKFAGKKISELNWFLVYRFYRCTRVWIVQTRLSLPPHEHLVAMALGKPERKQFLSSMFRKVCALEDGKKGAFFGLFSNSKSDISFLSAIKSTTANIKKQKRKLVGLISLNDSIEKRKCRAKN